MANLSTTGETVIELLCGAAARQSSRLSEDEVDLKRA
jgi:hypothetical protein